MLLMNSKIIATIWVAVFTFPGQAAAITSPCSTNNNRKPVTANSRQTIIATIQDDKSGHH